MMPTQFLANFPPSLGSEVAAGQHYMMIDSYESKNATTSEGKKLSSIGLYIPTGSLKTSFSGNYEPKEGMALKAAAGAGTINLGNKLKSLFSASDASAAAQEVLDAGSSIGQTASAAFAGVLGKTLDKTGFLSASGKSPNNYMALIYGGPNEFRMHSFAFKFFPRNQAETTTVQAIIEEFKRGTLPRMSGGTGTGKNLLDPYFKSPRQHTIKFMKGGKTGGGNQNPYLFTIGRSVITNMEINYDPQGTVGFHDDGSPVAIDLSLTFKEIAFQISSDNVDGQNKDLRGPILQNQAQATRAEGLAALSARGQVAAGQGFSSSTRDF
jgi:hypothetical protein